MNRKKSPSTLMVAGRPKTLLFLAVIAAAITVVWCGVVSPTPAFPHFFEFEVSAPVQIETRIFYSRGAGVRDSESAKEIVGPRESFTTVRLPLPPGKFRALRFEPTHVAGSIRLRQLRIVTFDGRTVRRFSAAAFSRNADVAELRERNGVIDLQTTTRGSNPQLAIEFDPVLRLGFGFWSKAFLYVPRWLLTFAIAFAGLVLGQLVRRTLLTSRIRIPTALRGFYQRRPRTALALCALLATAMSSYPVVFFGKSFVSPTFGALLLYDHAPTVPGYTDLRADDAHGADVGAMMWQHLPYTVQQNHALRAGALPLWNRYSSSGVTLFGQGQSMFGDPLQLLVIAAEGASWAFDLKFIIVKALFACGVGWCVWALTRDFVAAAIATFASVFIGFFNYRINHPAIFSLGYSPWILVGWLQLAVAVDRRAFGRALALWFLANWFVITSGTVKEAYFLALSLNFTGALAFLFSQHGRKEKIIRALFIGAAGVAFVLATSPVWWSFFHALSTAYTAYETPTVFQIRREWFVGLFDDLFYREFVPDNQVHQPSTNFLILLGCFFAVLQPRRLWADRRAAALLVTVLGALSLAFQWGPPTSSPTWVYQVPFLRNVHHFHNVFSCVAVVHLAILAGWGFSAARRPLAAGRSARFTLSMAGIFVVMFVPYFVIEPPDWTGHRWFTGSDVTVHQAIVYLHVILLPLSIWVLMRVAAIQLKNAIITGMAAAAAAIALVIVVARHGQHLPFAAPNAFLVTPGTRGNLLLHSPAVDFLRAEIAREPARVVGTGNNLFPGFATVYDLEGINGPNALNNRPYRELCEAAGLLAGSSWRYILEPDALAESQPVLDFLNVRYVAAPPNRLHVSSGYQRVAQLDFDIYRSERVWPRAFFTNEVVAYSTPVELVRLIADRSRSQPFAAVQNTEHVPELFSFANADDRHALTVTAHQYTLETNRTSFNVVAPGPGVVVLQEPWLADDFRASIDGREVPYFRVNHAFKALAIPAAGTYRIAFEYWPKGLTLTLWLSAIGIGGFALLLLQMARTARPVVRQPFFNRDRISTSSDQTPSSSAAASRD